MIYSVKNGSCKEPLYLGRLAAGKLALGTAAKTLLFL